MSTWHLISVRLLAGVSCIENTRLLPCARKMKTWLIEEFVFFRRKVTHQLTDLKVEVSWVFVWHLKNRGWKTIVSFLGCLPGRYYVSCLEGMYYCIAFCELLADIFCYANFLIGCKSGDIQGNQLIRDSHILSFPKRWPIWCRAPRCLCVPLKTKMTDAQKRAVSVRVISCIVFFSKRCSEIWTG